MLGWSVNSKPKYFQGLPGGFEELVTYLMNDEMCHKYDTT